MRKLGFLVLIMSLVVFSCKTQQEKEEKPAVETPVVEKSQDQTEVTILCPADMKKVDSLMAMQLRDVAETIEQLKPKTVVVTGHTARLNSEREEEVTVNKQIQLIVEYLDSIGALDYVDVVVENKGASEPVVNHTDISGRNANRRVIITLK